MSLVCFAESPLDVETGPVRLPSTGIFSSECMPGLGGGTYVIVDPVGAPGDIFSVGVDIFTSSLPKQTFILTNDFDYNIIVREGTATINRTIAGGVTVVVTSGPGYAIGGSITFKFSDELDYVIVGLSRSMKIPISPISNSNTTLVATNNECDIPFTLTLVGELDESLDVVVVSYDVTDCSSHSIDLLRGCDDRETEVTTYILSNKDAETKCKEYTSSSGRVSEHSEYVRQTGRTSEHSEYVRQTGRTSEHSEYYGSLSKIDDGMRLSVLNLEVVDTIKGSGTVREKTAELDVDHVILLPYILVKIIMGWLLFDELNTKWALTQNYPKLLRGILRNQQYRNILPWLMERSNLEVYLR